MSGGQHSPTACACTMTGPALPTKAERRNRRRERRTHKCLFIPSIFEISQLTLDTQQWYRSYRNPLSPQALVRAETVWRYISQISPAMRMPRENWFHVLQKQLWPEGAVFQWEGVIMTCIDMPYIRDQLDPQTYHRLLYTNDAPTLIMETEHVPLHDVNSLESEQVFNSRWRDLPQETRDECGMNAMLHFFMGSDHRYAELEHSDDVGMARLSATRVISSRAHEHINFFNLNRQMWGKHFSAMCSGCEKMSPDCKKCAACGQVYYCGKECQKKDWPAHKASCKKHKATRKDDVASDEANNAHVRQSQ